MKLGIFCNFSHRSVGGSEIVLKEISERLVKQFNYEVAVYSYSVHSSFSENGVKYVPCKRGYGLIAQINENDHIFVYSDSFWGWDTIVEKIDRIDCEVSVALVGAYHMQSHPKTLDLLKKNIDRFNLITHSSITPDYKWCIDNGLPVEVIPNGVNLEEFRQNTIDFREKYNIKEKYVILNVGNFFYGKGFELLPQICRRISTFMQDFIILQVSNVVKYPYDKIFFERTKKQSKGMNIRFFRDLPREDVIAAFKNADTFLFTSKKEVAPLVILEARVAETPWLSMDVGNLEEQKGGMVLKNKNKDHKGYKIVDDILLGKFAANVGNIVRNKRINKDLTCECQQDIKKSDWENIVPLYDKVFSNEV